MPINSRQKGARAERAWRDRLKSQGWEARRGQQFSGGTESPDVVCPDLDVFHFECKHVEALNIHAAMNQARTDAAKRFCAVQPDLIKPKFPIVAHKRNGTGWLVTMPDEVFFELVKKFIKKPEEVLA